MTDIDVKETPRTWSPMKMLDLCYRASDATRELMRLNEKTLTLQAEEQERQKTVAKLTEIHTTLANFTNEVQHVWDEYVELLDLISEARGVITRTNLDADWTVRQMLDQHDFIIRTWDREEA